MQTTVGLARCAALFAEKASLERVMIPRHPLLTVALFILVLGGCSSEPESRFTDPFEAFAGAQYSAFARSLAEAINEGRPRPFNTAVDTRALLTTAYAKHGLSDAEIEQIALAVPDGLGLGDSLCAWTEVGGVYQAIMLHLVEERPAILFRLIQADGGLSYHDVVFGGTHATGPRIVDIFYYTTGEFLSESMGRMLTSSGSTVASRVVERFNRNGPKVSPMRRALDSMRRIAADGRPELALRYFAELPEELRSDKLLLIERLGIARSVGEREADAAVRDMRRFHSGDVSLNLHLLDHYFVRNELDSTLATIDRLDKAVEGDPYLAFLRSNVYRIRKDSLNMRLWAERALHGDRSLNYPYWTLLDLSLGRRDYKETWKLLRWLERFARYDVDELEIESDPRYEGFVASKEHAEWVAWRARWNEKMKRHNRPPEPSFPAQPKGEHDDDEGLQGPDIDADDGPEPGV